MGYIMTEGLEYSINAENVLSDFYESDYVVFVEDKDDQFFWSKIFERILNGKKFAFRFEENITGCGILDKKIKDIESGDLDSSILVARDSDYLDFKQEKSTHNRVLYTYGHSIENCLFSYENLNNIINSYSRGVISPEHIKCWLENIEVMVNRLIKLDIISQVNGYGIEILRKSCEQFLLEENPIILDDRKIESKISEVQAKIGNITNINDEIEKLEDIPFYYLRGHFFVSLIANFIRRKCPVRSLPIDGLMSSAFMTFQDSLQKEDLRWKYYSEICGKLC